MRRSCLRLTILVLAVVVQFEGRAVSAAYTVMPFLNERQMKLDGFHFATLLEDVNGQLIFRPHPDMADVNGWGTSWHVNPFLAGANAGYGVIDSITPGASGITMALHGQVARPGGLTYGTWVINGMVSYDPVAKRINGSGTLNISLDGTLAAAGKDLNLEKIASNFLHNVDRQIGGNGDTGDMKHAVIKYAAVGDPRDFIWNPPTMPTHFPFDFSNYIEVEVTGQLNTVVTSPQIAIARKPTFKLSYNLPNDQMIVGLFWNEALGGSFEQDNVGINHLLIQGQTSNTNFAMTYQFESTVIPYVPGDFDYDGDVDGADFVIWQTHFPTATGATWSTGDADGDEDVDGADFVVWQTHFPYTPGPGIASVPEPGAGVLALIGAASLLSMRASWRNPPLFHNRKTSVIRPHWLIAT